MKLVEGRPVSNVEALPDTKPPTFTLHAQRQAIPRPITRTTPPFRVDDEIRSLLSELRNQRNAPRTRITLAVQPDLALSIDQALFRRLLSKIVLMCMLQPLTTAVLITARIAHSGAEVVVCHDGIGGPLLEYFSDDLSPAWSLRYDLEPGAVSVFTLALP